MLPVKNIHLPGKHAGENMLSIKFIIPVLPRNDNKTVFWFQPRFRKVWNFLELSSLQRN